MLLIHSKLIISKKVEKNSYYVKIHSIKIKKNITKTILIIKIKILQQINILKITNTTKK